MRNRLLVLMGEKQARDAKPINASTVARETGLTRQAVHKWLNNEITQFNDSTIEKLCEFFNCEIGDLLYIDRSKMGKKQEEESA